MLSSSEPGHSLCSCDSLKVGKSSPVHALVSQRDVGNPILEVEGGLCGVAGGDLTEDDLGRKDEETADTTSAKEEK